MLNCDWSLEFFGWEDEGGVGWQRVGIGRVMEGLRGARWDSYMVPRWFGWFVLGGGEGDDDGEGGGEHSEKERMEVGE